MTTSHVFDLKTVHDLDQLGVRKPALFLSASLPGQADLDGKRAYADKICTQDVRSAVSWLCRYLFDAEVQLIFGGHPEITPIVLAAASQATVNSTDEPLVYVFQSRFFENELPAESWALADLSRGCLVWTEARDTQEESLRFMRACMTQVPGLVGAVFVGGMDGALQEASLFEQNRPIFGDGPAPLYAIASTGGATAALYDENVDQRRGGLSEATMLDVRTYAEVAGAIVDDLKDRGLIG